MTKHYDKTVGKMTVPKEGQSTNPKVTAPVARPVPPARTWKKTTPPLKA